MAVYSKRTLVEKLGIKEGFRILILNQPDNYEHLLSPLPKNIERLTPDSEKADFIQFFTTEKKELQKEFPKLKQALVPSGSLWVSWPKTGSKLQTDLNENIIRDIGLENELVDVKVIVIDEIWSGLKFIYRLKDRNTKR